MTDWLERVYTAGNDTAKLAEVYDAWADEYDDSVGQVGYTNPAVVTALFARLMPDVAAPVLDAGCGTGLIGHMLGLVGYRDVTGIDLSPGMLKRAAARGCYRALSTAVLGEPLSFPDAAFAGVVASGVFTVGHAPASAFGEIARVMRPGGVFVVSITDPVYEAGGFKAAIDKLAAGGTWERAAESGSYLPLPGADDSHRHPGRVYAMRRR
ncbi:MAG: class I SAM-dependent methyltransferase [Thalassobaculum sp.]|uniref:class I SAM-dependent DNA methyltransferase n=1 Tax=Thalassobaculum sp. TaxID=2022740 RepID=UPI0032EC764E